VPAADVLQKGAPRLREIAEVATLRVLAEAFAVLVRQLNGEKIHSGLDSHCHSLQNRAEFFYDCGQRPPLSFGPGYTFYVKTCFHDKD
jgi:hypothetical protein